MASLNKSSPITGDQAREVGNQIVQLIKDNPYFKHDWWYNSTPRKGVRTLRVRLFYRAGYFIESLIHEINMVLRVNLKPENYRTIQRGYTQYDVTMFYFSNTLTPRPPYRFSNLDLCIWRADKALHEKHFQGTNFTEYIVAYSEIPVSEKNDWLYPTFVERVAGPFRSNRKLQETLNRLNG